MNVMVLGNGSREHALVWKFSQSKRVSGLYAVPGNAGTRGLATNLAIDPCDSAALIAACRERKVELVMIGPEQPLEAGVADALREAGILAFGPGKAAAQLECSKAFARRMCEKARIPCAKTTCFPKGEQRKFEGWLRGWGFHFGRKAPPRIVLKKSGLAAGKGVLETEDYEDALAYGSSVLKDDDLVIEEFLRGWEMSVFALCDENGYVTCLPCADHKKAGTGDTGPNTGGMGAICPVPAATQSVMDRVEREIIAPTFEAMRKEGLSYRGVLFFGIMVTAQGPRLLEYNVRFGDPETQSLLPLIENDFIDLAEAVASGRLSEFRLLQSNRSALGVVIAAPGYPGDYPKGIPVAEPDIHGIKGSLLFHAATKRAETGALLTGGGRCFTAVGVGEDFMEASAIAYETAALVDFEGAWHRPDIGAKYLKGGNE